MSSRGYHSTFLCRLSWGESDDREVGLPMPSLSLSRTMGPCPGADCEDAGQTSCIGCCLASEAPSSKDDQGRVLEDEDNCEVVINGGWDTVADEEGGVVGLALGEWRGENLGDTFVEWGDDGALLDWCWEECPLPSVEVCRFLMWLSDNDLS